MTTGPRSQCDTCARFRSAFDRPEGQQGLGPFCAAFPDAIPRVILRNGMDHRQPIDGDHGLRWESAAGEPFPVSAFPPEFLGRGGPIAVLRTP